jgi:uncharacterized protein (TIGR02145 family)
MTIQHIKQPRLTKLGGLMVASLCLAVALLSQQLIKPAEAITSTITVTDNNQTITTQQNSSATVINKTSVVNVTDSGAATGYKLVAALNNSLNDATVEISAPSSSNCPSATPCLLSTTPTIILTTSDAAATDPAGQTTTFDVKITIPANVNIGNYTLDIVYDELGAPSITGVSPTSGTLAGGTPITITGAGFAGATAVKVGGTNCASFSVVSDTTINCATPTHAIGTVAISVTNPDGIIGTSGNIFTYTNNIQDITTANCPTAQTRVKDARDNHSYYVRKFDSLCWMMTNLSYAGSLTASSADEDSASLTLSDYSTATYFVNKSGTTSYVRAEIHTAPGGYGVTVEPNNPSTATGASSSAQYGYLYNWCAAMGAQDLACNDTATSGFDTSISICPAGWRLPVGNGADFQNLYTALGSAPANAVSVWLGVYSGYYVSSLTQQTSSGLFYSSTTNTAQGRSAYHLAIDGSVMNTVRTGNKNFSNAVRCVANSI